MTTASNAASVAKLGALFFASQTRYPAAPTHKPLLHHLREALRRRRAAAELARLSDRELADIGLTRQGIDAAVCRQPSATR